MWGPLILLSLLLPSPSPPPTHPPPISHPATSFLLPAGRPRSAPRPRLPSAGWPAGLIEMDGRAQVDSGSPLPDALSLLGDKYVSTWVWAELPCLLGPRSRAGRGSCTTTNLGQGYRRPRPLSPSFELGTEASSSSEQRWLPWLCAHLVRCRSVEMTRWSSSAQRRPDPAIAMVLGCGADLEGGHGCP
jgi:hypothetical protein